MILYRKILKLPEKQMDTETPTEAYFPSLPFCNHIHNYRQASYISYVVTGRDNRMHFSRLSSCKRLDIPSLLDVSEN
jgi:hypothetical protein